MTTAINLPADKFDTTMTFVRPENAPTRVALDNLAVLPGFNTRVKDADYSERVAGIAESIVANGFFDDKPFAVTMLPGDDTVYIYDGEHRFDAAKAALLDGAEFPDGLPVAWAKDGATVRDLTIHLAHGNAGERLNMVELAAVVRRMQGLGMSKDEIATALGRTTRHVDNLFVLADANQAVKKAVASGKIAGAEAVKLVRKHGTKDAAAEITARIKKAEEQGKAKATPKTTASAPTGPKMKKVAITMNFGSGDVMGDILKNMAKAIRAEVQIGDGDKLAEDGKIEITVHVVDREAEAAKAAAEKAKAEAAAKREAEKKAKAEEAAAKKAATEKAKAEAAAKREAEKKLLAEAAAKKPAAKGKAAPKGKTPEKAKPKQPAQKPQNAKKPAPATEPPATPPEATSAPESADDGMGGL
jgi:ParB-like chromosome segregation protein Spo0J